jgi:hypothetical protein
MVKHGYNSGFSLFLEYVKRVIGQLGEKVG